MLKSSIYFPNFEMNSDFQDIQDQNIFDTVNFPEFDSRSILCIKCQKTNSFHNKLCLDCLVAPLKCIECKEFYKLKDECYCSVCKIMLQYKNKDLTFEDVLDLPECDIKGELLELNLEKVFQLYKFKGDLKHIVLKDENMFKILLKICKNLSAKNIKKIFKGKTGFPPYILFAKHADQLLSQSLDNNISEEEQYEYIHAIAPYILDVWNMKNKNNVFLCYFKLGGDLTKCPNKVSFLFELWNRIKE